MFLSAKDPLHSTLLTQLIYLGMLELSCHPGSDLVYWMGERFNLGPGFIFFSPLFGEDFQFDDYFSDGLKPPTSNFKIYPESVSTCPIRKTPPFIHPGLPNGVRLCVAAGRHSHMCILIAGGMEKNTVRRGQSRIDDSSLAGLNRSIPCLKLTVKGTPEHRPFYQRKVVAQLSFFGGASCYFFTECIFCFLFVCGEGTLVHHRMHGNHIYCQNGSHKIL